MTDYTTESKSVHTCRGASFLLCGTESPNWSPALPPNPSWLPSTIAAQLQALLESEELSRHLRVFDRNYLAADIDANPFMIGHDTKQRENMTHYNAARHGED
jgi:hypothetical protein